MRTLIIEDNHVLAAGLKQALESDGYCVDNTDNGNEGYRYLSQQEYDLLVLDLGLPGKDGIEILKALRKKSNLPVLIISARDQIDQRIQGLNLGADDYICKPFDPNEIVARANAVLRRAYYKNNSLIEYGDIVYDTLTHRLTVDGDEIAFHRRELHVFEYLVSHTKRVISKEQIAQHISSFDEDVNPTAIETYISRIRKKLGKSFQLKTVRGLGYFLEDYQHA